MRTIVEQLGDGRTLVSDGAWGTFLQKKGLKPGDCPELWCVDRPDDVLEIARSYIDAGSDMIQTNTFGGTSFKLEMYGLQDRAAEINRAGAEISRRAAGPDRHVIASVGPTGKMLMMGDVTEEELYNAFAEQAKALEEGGANACCIETMMDPAEACIAVRAAKENSKLEVVATFTFEPAGEDKYRTLMGTAPADAAASVLSAGADVIGANCGNGLDQMVPIVSAMKNANPNVPILVHANAGRPVSQDGVDVFPESPEDMAGWIPNVVSAGADIVGGCCGTTPEHITAIVKAVEKLGRESDGSQGGVQR